MLLQAPPPVTPVDTTGAGDCFCGALAQALARGADLAARGPVRGGRGGAVDHRPGARGALPDDDAVRALLPRMPDAAGLG